MSRIGRKPIQIPEGVEIDVKPGAVSVKGPKGELDQSVDRDMKVAIDDGTLTVARPPTAASTARSTGSRGA